MPLKAAFIFVAPEANSSVHRSWVKTQQIELLAVAAPDYAAAETLVRELIDQEGINAIELCGGFGHEGVARIKKIAGNAAAVGVVRFDNHPGLEFKSGDALF